MQPIAQRASLTCIQVITIGCVICLGSKVFGQNDNPQSVVNASAAPAPQAVAPANSFLQFEGAPIELQLNTGLWLPRLRGNVTYGAAGAPNLDLSTALSLDAMEPSFYGDINATWKNWMLRVTGTSFKSTGSIGATCLLYTSPSPRDS